jgi:hypothetical protein
MPAPPTVFEDSAYCGLAVRSSDLCADRGIGGLERRLRPRGRASLDADKREHGEEKAKHPPVKRHRASAPLPKAGRVFYAGWRAQQRTAPHLKQKALRPRGTDAGKPVLIVYST